MTDTEPVWFGLEDEGQVEMLLQSLAQVYTMKRIHFDVFTASSIL